jgi:lysophospholipase L1-like esterase
MKTFLYLLLGFCICLYILPVFAQEVDDNTKRNEIYHNYFEKTVLKFQAEDLKTKPAKDAIVVVGSSSISFWHPTIKEDLAPLTVIPRGISGCDISDVLYYADKIIIPYQPRAVLIYAGENDIVMHTTPEKVCSIFVSLIDKIQKSNPEVRIYFISIKPSVSRWYLWAKMSEANRLIEAECKKDSHLSFIDITNSLLGEDQKPNPIYFKSDQIHLSKKGYEVWSATIKPILIKNEEKFEIKDKEAK